MADIDLCRGLFADFTAVDRDKGRTEPVETAKVLVAGRLINRAFPTQFRVQRHHRDTVGLHPAIATALTDIGVDHHTTVGIGEIATLAPTTFFCGTGLHVNNGRYTADFA